MTDVIMKQPLLSPSLYLWKEIVEAAGFFEAGENIQKYSVIRTYASSKQRLPNGVSCRDRNDIFDCLKCVL